MEMDKTKFDFCPNCNTDLREGNLMYVESGCDNYTYYKKDHQVGWLTDNEIDGENPSETFYACGRCQVKLPEEYQEYFPDNL